MNDHRKRVANIAVEQHVELDQIALTIAGKLVVQRRIAAGTALERVEEIENDFVQRHFVAQHDAVALVLHIAELAALLLAQIHQRADVFFRRVNVRQHVRLAHFGDGRRIGHVRRVVQPHLGAVGFRQLVDDVGRGGDQIQIKLALEPHLDNFHMQQPEEPAAEAVTQRGRRFRLENERSVVQAELVQRFMQRLVVRAVGGINAAVHHGADLTVARQRFFGGIVGVGDRVSHTGIDDILDGRADIAHVARTQLVHGDIAGLEAADLNGIECRTGGHHADARARAYRALHDADITHRAAIIIVERIEYQRLERFIRVALRSGNILDDVFEHFVNVQAVLGADERRVARVQADDVLDLAARLFRLRAGQVDLVDDRDDFEVVIQRHVNVGQRLRFHALRGVDHQQRALARGQRARNLVGEVNVAGRVDEVEDVRFTVLRLVFHAHRLRFDGDAALALEFHRIQHLIHHLALLENAGALQQAVGQRALAVVDVRDNAEIANMIHPFGHVFPPSSYNFPNYYDKGKRQKKQEKLSKRKPGDEKTVFTEKKQMFKVSSCCVHLAAVS